MQMLALLARHPRALLWRRWNWKAAITSALIRAAIFFAVNAAAGWRAAAGAFAAELAFRVSTSGFYGAITEAFTVVRPVWRAAVTTMVGLPLLSHALEFALHYLRGTPELGRSISASLAFTAVSTAFNLFAMRRGALVVGEGHAPLRHDLRRMPGLIGEFVLYLVQLLTAPFRRRWIL